MSNDLLKQLEAKINEAIETIEFSRMEITDLKEKNDELEIDMKIGSKGYHP